MTSDIHAQALLVAAIREERYSCPAGTAQLKGALAERLEAEEAKLAGMLLDYSMDGASKGERKP